MAITFTKVRSASRSYGRGSDSSYQPASYNVLKDGKVVGAIYSHGRGYMGSSSWYIDLSNGKGNSAKTLKDAKKKAVRMLG